MVGKTFYINRGLTRRDMLGLAAGLSGSLALASVLPAFADDRIGEVLDAKGNVLKTQNDVETKIRSGAPLNNNDLMSTGEKSFASMRLGNDTKIIMGSNTEVVLDSFLAEQGGTLELVSGDMVFDRPEGMPTHASTFRSASAWSRSRAARPSARWVLAKASTSPPTPRRARCSAPMCRTSRSGARAGSRKPTRALACCSKALYPGRSSPEHPPK